MNFSHFVAAFFFADIFAVGIEKVYKQKHPPLAALKKRAKQQVRKDIGWNPTPANAMQTRQAGFVFV